ncbi:MAG: stage 0 sporulation protein [Myxococcales bacterium]|nr:stage 0 sporulation protein [Myxococcales bacterium]
MATVAVASTRRALRDRLGRRVLRKADPAPEAGHGDGGLLRLAKDRAAALRLPIKVFRVEYATPPGAGGRGGKANLYFTSDERVELRELLRDLGQASGARIELRQVGARDEAKQVGGIGSCGQELCCSTWLPEFVPVSIKMAKDQGMVLSPTKVSGQCGRLKCCLVYEQATYAELRKGLPKLGKRVITASGEGRVVEVDVIRQRVRVAFGPGESQMMPASEVKPMFPPQGKPGAPAPEHDDEPDEPAEEPVVDGTAPPDPALT